MNESYLNAMLRKSRVLVSEAEISAAIERMAAVLDQRFQGKVPVAICIMTGGLMLTARLISSVKIQTCLDFLQTSRYRGSTQGGALQWRIKPAQSLQGRPVVLIDDIFDEGHTLASIADYCVQQGASEVFSVVLLDKKHDRKIAGFKPDLVGLDIADEYVVGFGMDYKGYFRQLRDIYSIEGALAEQSQSDVI